MYNKLTAVDSDNLLAPSPEFKKEAFNAVLAIAAFIFVYLLLFFLSLCFVALCFGAGIWVMTAKVGFITILVGLGIIGCGITVFVFLIKFLFASSKMDESDSLQIYEADHPRLFQSIRTLAEQIGTPMPKKVFISPDVNAAVFYNSSFWSMFLPVRKNLKIGLGLINGLNISELESVIAHEFGHFSQRSMKVGSWVYQVNRMIFDMLFNNQRFAEGVDNLSNVHGIFQLFALLTIKIIQGIQWVLGQMYKVVNKGYLGLSRQMEFHADLVAASVCGSNNVISALRRSEFANECFDTTIEVCGKAWQDKRVVSNFYAAHSLIIISTGRKRQWSFDGSLPSIAEDLESGVSRINYKDQWSSHPTLAERQQHLESYSLVAGVNSNPAWDLLENSDGLKAQLTEKIYRDIPREEVKENFRGEEIELWLKGKIDQETFPTLFKDYYDQRQVEAFDVEAVAAQPITFTTFTEVFDEDAAALPKKLNLLQQDVFVLQAIASGHIDTRSFDFDGQKCKAKEAHVVIEQLQEELKGLEGKLKERDRWVFRYFYAVAPMQEAEGLKRDYQSYFQQRREADRFLECVNAMMEPLEPVFQGETLPIETILELISKLKSEHEPAFKKALRERAACFSSVQGLQESVAKFLEADYQYFHEKSFFDNELRELNRMVQECWEAISKCVFEQFRAITVKQAQIEAAIANCAKHRVLN